MIIQMVLIKQVSHTINQKSLIWERDRLGEVGLDKCLRKIRERVGEESNQNVL